MTSHAGSRPEAPSAPHERDLLLVLCNCEERLQLALGRIRPKRPPELLAARELNVPRRTVQFLMPAVEAMLDEQERGPAHLDRIAVVRGPGSFTGIRLALAAAAGLAAGHRPDSIKRPLMAGLDYLPLVAAGALAASARPVAAVTYARRGHVYLQRFAPEGTERGPVESMPAADAAALLAGLAPHVIAGSGLEKNPAEFTSLAGSGHTLLGPEFAAPSPHLLLAAAAAAHYGHDPVEPAYGRTADAEQNLDQIARARGIDPDEARSMLDRSRGQV